ncbi:MAG: hypothetical protein GY706_08675, partial [Bacteroides sp.]|nr:hypothetical protein [Bacteroides sp.]
QEIRVTKLEERVADIEKHIHGDVCGCVHCEQGAKAAAYFKASRKLEPDAYKDLSGLDLTDMFARCGDIKTETHPAGTVEGLRAELDIQKGNVDFWEAAAKEVRKTADNRKEEIDGLRAELMEIENERKELYIYCERNMDYSGADRYSRGRNQAYDDVLRFISESKAIRGKSAQHLPPHISQ